MSLTAQLLAHQQGHEIALHEHPQGQLTVVLGGTTNLHNELGWWLATPGTAIWIPPHVYHQATYREHAEVINLLVGIDEGGGLPLHCCLVLVSDLLRELAKEAARLGNSAQQQVSNSIRELVLAQLRSSVVGPELYVPDGQDKRLRQVIARLRADPGIQDDIPALAAGAFTSSRTLARLFVKETGMTFTQWRERLRVVVAIDRLLAGQAVTSIALDVGYQSASAFTAVFTRVMGTPPRIYLAQMNIRAE